MTPWRVRVPVVCYQEVIVLADSADNARAQVISRAGTSDGLWVLTEPQYDRVLADDPGWYARDLYPGTDGEPLIDSVAALAKHLGVRQDERAIAHDVYKSTACGACFAIMRGDMGVTLAGYCEGTDAECPVHDLPFPFPASAWTQTLARCDKDAIMLWNETHGCAECARMLGERYRPGCIAVQPGCPSCGGRGEVL